MSIKQRHYLKLYWKIVWRDFKQPVMDNANLFQFLTIPILVYLSFPSWAEYLSSPELSQFKRGTLAFALSIPTWFVLNLILAAIRLKNEERKEGTWEGNRFVYHVPKHIKTVVGLPSAEVSITRLHVPDVPAKAMVKFKFEYEGGLGKAQITNHEKSVWSWNGIGPKTTHELRLDGKAETVLAVNCPVESIETVIRIYSIYWAI